MMQELEAVAQLAADLYESDFYAWTQAKLLQVGAWDRLDIPNWVEQIESLRLVPIASTNF